jgi:hypothetical protein
VIISSPRRRFLVLSVMLMAVAASCGGSQAPVVQPARVPTDIVPATVEGDLTVTEFPPARTTFAKAGITSLVADGKVWAIRRGETLVGTLQVSTVKPDVSVTTKEDRRAILDGVMTGSPYETIQLGSLDVAASTSADKTLYLWFGPKLFEVLQVKGSKVDPDSIAADLIEFQQSTGKIGPGGP